jgi:hypothetical protein
MYINDIISGSNFLVDTGASRTVWPFQSDKQPYGPILEGANGAHIPAWGARRLHVKFGGQEFSFSFIRAAVQVPILGNDFLWRFWLLVDPAGGCVRAASMEPLAYAVDRVPRAASTVAAVGSGALMEQLVAEFPAVFSQSFSQPQQLQETTGDSTRAPPLINTLCQI